MAGRRHIYKTQGTCSQFIEVELSDDGTLSDVTFVGGCNGNLQGISSLVRGMKVDDIINKLNGIRCGYKSTSWMWLQEHQLSRPTLPGA